MQNRYAADVGDFGKFGLLRGVGSGFKIGVVWYLTNDETHNQDGKFTEYLVPTNRNLGQFRECDPDLYDLLQPIGRALPRSVKQISEANILPIGTQFYEEVLSFNEMPWRGPSTKTQRLIHRQTWLAEAAKVVNDCNLVFLDPDNGLASKHKRHTKLGPKHVFPDEACALVRSDQTLILYHHLSRWERGKSSATLARELVDRLAKSLKQHAHPIALLCHRGSARAFIIVPSPSHEMEMRDRTARFLLSHWMNHFERVDLS